MNRSDPHPMQIIKDMMQEWAHYYRPDKAIGYPKQSAFVTERVQTSNRSSETFIEEIPAEITRLNNQIELLAPLFKQVIHFEYFDKRPTKTKAALLKIPRQVFAQRLCWCYEQLNFSMFGE